MPIERSRPAGRGGMPAGPEKTEVWRGRVLYRACWCESTPLILSEACVRNEDRDEEQIATRSLGSRPVTTHSIVGIGNKYAAFRMCSILNIALPKADILLFRPC